MPWCTCPWSASSSDRVLRCLRPPPAACCVPAHRPPGVWSLVLCDLPSPAASTLSVMMCVPVGRCACGFPPAALVDVWLPVARLGPTVVFSWYLGLWCKKTGVSDVLGSHSGGRCRQVKSASTNCAQGRVASSLWLRFPSLCRIPRDDLFWVTAGVRATTLCSQYRAQHQHARHPERRCYMHPFSERPP